MDTRSQVRACISQGSAYLLSGKINEAIVKFDAAHQLDPKIDPWLWQRGLAYYFAARYQEGADQFERDMAVNSQDTEESVWRFLCQARGQNLEFARSNLILPTEGDSRIPMYQALKLFQGSGTEEEVLGAVEKVPEGPKKKKALFYGRYYVRCWEFLWCRADLTMLCRLGFSTKLAKDSRMPVRGSSLQTLSSSKTTTWRTCAGCMARYRGALQPAHWLQLSETQQTVRASAMLKLHSTFKVSLSSIQVQSAPAT